MPQVAILGSTGFVGLRLCQELQKAGFGVTAFARRKSAFLLQGFDIRVASPDEIGREKYPIVINLAYPNGPYPYLYEFENRSILDNVLRLCTPDSRVIHFSSLAVFGADLRHPISKGLPPLCRDRSYVECKARIEHGLSAGRQGRRLDIIRPGNVWGPGSPNWVAGIIHRLKNGLPLGVQGKAAFSNITDVANLVDYVLYLLKGAQTEGMEFHHIAEFSNHRWEEIIGFLGSKVGRRPMLLPEFRVPDVSIGSVLRMTAGAFQQAVLSVFRHLNAGRTSGSFVRSAFSKMPESLLAKLKGLKDRGSPADPSYTLAPGDEEALEVFTCDVEFKQDAHPNWRPPVSYSESISRVDAWMRTTGFC